MKYTHTVLLKIEPIHVYTLYMYDACRPTQASPHTPTPTTHLVLIGGASQHVTATREGHDILICQGVWREDWGRGDHALRNEVLRRNWWRGRDGEGGVPLR